MFLSEIHIDGFKSYAQRTVISGWDPEFNAITGLNGSGKSNILDAICFVLGISNLSQVRASGLQDLVYKQGQAGITKATVTLVFNNSDAKQSPIGYEHHDSITVSRQVIIGGRNKYMINGNTVQQSNVQNLFQSVGLNVNNPHFLIMQGRITKVLNMKPKETLGLIEEAAGTRMYEMKKEAAVKTIEKKHEKVDQINRVLKDEITPTLEKLQRERADYLKWAASNTECERLSRLCIAWEYTQAEQLKSGSAGEVAKLQGEVAASMQAAADRRAGAEAKGVEIAAQDAKLAAARSGEHAALAEQVEAFTRDVNKADASHRTRAGELAAEEKARDAAVKGAREGEAARAALAAGQEKARTEAGAAKAEAARLSAELEVLQKRLIAVRAGMRDEGGSASAGTVADQLREAKSKVTHINTELKKGESNAEHLRKKVKDLAAALAREEKDGAALSKQVEAMAKSLEAKKGALAALGFDAKRAAALKAQHEAMAAEVTRAQEQLDNDSSNLSHRLNLAYDRRNMGAGWDDKRVKGSVAQLVGLKKKDAAYALEVVAGAKLWQVVVDNDETGKLLLERGKLQNRVTLVPLTTIRGRAPTPQQIAAATQLSGGKAYPAVSCVSIAPEYQRVADYVFGSAFICESDEVAKAVAFNPACRCLAVTLRGDVYDPAGTLEGGSSPASGSSMPLLVRLAAMRELSERLAKAKAEAAALEAEIASMDKAARAYEEAERGVEMAQHNLDLTQQRMEASSLGQTRASLASKQKELEGEEAALVTNKELLKSWAGKVKELEAEEKNAEAARKARVSAVEGELAKTQKAAASAEEKSRKLTAEADKAGFELEAASKASAAEAAAIAERNAAVAKLSQETAALAAALASLKARLSDAKTKLSEAQAAIAAADKARSKLVKEREKELEAADAADRETRRLEAEVKKVQAAAGTAERTLADLMVKHPWIASERSSFGASHSDYDFQRNDPKAASAKLKALAAEQAKREKSINKKVMGMIESAEREYGELKRKKDIIENDKAKINKVIAELDEKKNEALRTTWAKVNKDFGSIFTTLLPGTTAKLEPPQGGTVLDGLEVRVAFNKVWKESLTELSGGQRSLLALSLILALLLFKPAPMYILDEVDAALDMSHTQNIGVMIRRYFSQSQFIVVSLKQGMFSNANVIFRTKFVDGTSTVTRTVPAGSDLLKGAGAGAGGQRMALEDAENDGAGAGAGAGAGKGSKGGKGGKGGGKGGAAEEADDAPPEPSAKRRVLGEK